MSKLVVFNHPLMDHKLALIRDEKTGTKDFRQTVSEIGMLMAYEITRDLPQKEIEVKTPVSIAKCKTLAKEVVIIPILRAGLIFTDEAVDILPQATIRHIGMYRDEKTLKPVWYYNKVPMPVDKPEDYYVYITDPMLATGNSLLEAIRLYIEKGIPEENVCCVCMIASPQGVDTIFKEFPNVKLIVASVDSHLNERGYIVPGMGDAGDRIFNT